MSNWTQKTVAALSLTLLVGCSFHSSQWESAKTLLAMWPSKTRAVGGTYWWDMVIEGQTYRLFPVAWKDKVVLTDVSRWMVVLQNGEIMMVRDSQKQRQILFDHSVKLGEVERDVIASGYAGLSLESGNEAPEGMSITTISEGPTSKWASAEKTSILCAPPRFNAQTLQLVRACAFGETNFNLGEVGFDHSGDIIKLKVKTLSGEAFVIRRSKDVVDVPAIERRLQGAFDAS